MDSTGEAESDGPRRPVASNACRAIAWLTLIAIAAVALRQGLELRSQIWLRSADTYYKGDLTNAYWHGDKIMRMARDSGVSHNPLDQPGWREFFAAYVGFYPSLNNPDVRKTDYPPLRLLVVALWVRHVQAREPWRTAWDDGSPDAAGPMLAFNTVCGAAAALGMFLLVWYCMWREQAGELKVKISWLHAAWWVCGPLTGAWFWAIVAQALRNGQWPSGFVMTGLLVLFILTVASLRSWPTPYRYWGCGLVAALLVWFNAAILVDGYAWPQWEVWPLPFFIFAALLAAADWWFTAGVLIVIGGMLKGQMFLVAPLFIFWPLFQGRPGACARWIAGAIFATAAVVWPWLLGNSAGRTWLVCIAGAALLMSFWFFRRPKPGQVTHLGKPPMWEFLGALFVAGGVAVWPLREGGSQVAKLGCFLLALLMAAPRFLPSRRAGIWLCLVLGVAIFVIGDRYGADWNWYTYGFKYGTEKFEQLVRGHNPTLPSLLVRKFGWDNDDIHAPVGPPFNCDIKTLLAGIYGICLLLCAAGCAIQHHRRDTRLLVALAAPWLLFTTIMAQMTLRYWLWSAALSAAFVGVSVGASLFEFLLMANATMVVVGRLLEFYRDDRGGAQWPTLEPIYQFTFAFFPDLAWMLMLLCLVYLWLAVAPRPRRASESLF